MFEKICSFVLLAFIRLLRDIIIGFKFVKVENRGNFRLIVMDTGLG